MKHIYQYIKNAVVVLVIFLLIIPYSPINKPSKVQAVKGTEVDLSGCKPSFSGKYNNNTEGVVFTLFEITGAGKAIKFTASFGGPLVGYVFNFSEFKPETITTPAPIPIPPPPPGTPTLPPIVTTTNYYIYKGPDSSTLKVSLKDDQIYTIEIKDFNSSTDANFKKFATVFNDKAKQLDLNLNDRSCSQAGLFGTALSAPIAFHGTNAPTIDLPGSDSLKRPNLKFTLKKAFNKGGLFTIDEDMFMFEATEIFGTDATKPYYKLDDYRNLVLVLLNGGKTFPAKCGDLGTYQDCNDYDKTTITISENLQLFFNHVYNAQPSDGSSTCGAVTNFKKADSSDAKKDTDLSDWPGTPPLDCLNVSDAGWLTKWGVVIKNVSVANPTGGTGGPDCGYALLSVGDAIKVAMCNLTMMVREWAFSLMCFAQDKLLSVISDAPTTGATGCDANPILKENKQKSMDNFN